jgi:hypothetical protein
VTGFLAAPDHDSAQWCQATLRRTMRCYAF